MHQILKLVIRSLQRVNLFSVCLGLGALLSVLRLLIPFSGFWILGVLGLPFAVFGFLHVFLMIKALR